MSNPPLSLQEGFESRFNHPVGLALDPTRQATMRVGAWAGVRVTVRLDWQGRVGFDSTGRWSCWNPVCTESTEQLASALLWARVRVEMDALALICSVTLTTHSESIHGSSVDLPSPSSTVQSPSEARPWSGSSLLPKKGSPTRWRMRASSKSPEG